MVGGKVRLKLEVQGQEGGTVLDLDEQPSRHAYIQEIFNEHS